MLKLPSGRDGIQGESSEETHETADLGLGKMDLRHVEPEWESFILVSGSQNPC